MRHFLLIGCLITATFATAQTKKDSEQVHATLGLHIDRIKGRKDQLTMFIDSLNNYNGGTLPTFLFDTCIDWKAYYWDDLHSATSVRWQILEKVNNKKALAMILRVRDNRLKYTCSHVSDKEYPYLTVPMIKKSFYQLIKERYKQL